MKRRTTFIPWLAAVIASGLLLSSCGLAGSALSGLAERASSAVRAGDAAAPQPDAQGVPVSNPVNEAQPVTIQTGPSADLETQIYQAVYQKANPSVVYIENMTRVRSNDGTNATVPESEGSGFVWDAAGHIVTNNHVVEGADALQVTFTDGVVLPAEVVGRDPDSDLAVIKVDPALAPLTPVEQGDIDAVQVGQRAIAIGNPFGLAGSMTTGIVSAIGRSVLSGTGYNIPLAIQTDAAINPGNSGGPLLNEHGQVIGVNFQIRSEARSNSGVGFAIPINIVQRVAPALIANGAYKHAWLGLSGQTFSPAWAEELGVPAATRGAYVITVKEGGPAQQGGLRGGEGETDIVVGADTQGVQYLPGGGDLVVAIDDRPVKTFDDLLIYLESEKSPGDTVALKVLRAGEEITVTVTLGERPQQTP
jgi:2-alkenal reductase